jgi:hypothetical protein
MIFDEKIILPAAGVFWEFLYPPCTTFFMGEKFYPIIFIDKFTEVGCSGIFLCIIICIGWIFMDPFFQLRTGGIVLKIDISLLTAVTLVITNTSCRW